ncbi:MAG: hypothetical protein NUV69_04735 [Candidatus Curtissbacteria bacterium]|nr:hypothetical protein [Candidatus Curtissbacteria bacterium]
MILNINRNNAFVSHEGHRFIFYLVPKAISRSKFSVEVYIATPQWKADPAYESVFSKEYEDQDTMQEDVLTLTLDLDWGIAEWLNGNVKRAKYKEEEILEVEDQTAKEAIQNLASLNNAQGYPQLIYLGEQILKCEYFKAKNPTPAQKTAKAQVLSAVGAAFLNTVELEKAKEFLSESVKISENAENLEALGMIYSSMGDKSSAVKNLNKALRLCKIGKQAEEKAIKNGTLDILSGNWDFTAEKIQASLSSL